MADYFARDLPVVRQIMENFISLDHVTKGLKQIYDVGITGWEKWWQVEFAIYLDALENVEEWDMEHEFEVDRRKIDGDRLYVDFGFTLNDWNGEYVFLELKQHDNYKKCIDMMFKDAEKFERLKKRSMDGIEKRSVFVVGLFKNEEMELVLGYFESCMDHYGFELEPTDFSFIEAKDHEWSMLIF